MPPQLRTPFQKPEQPPGPRLALPKGDPNSPEAMIMDFFEGLTGLPLGENASESKPGAIGELAGMALPVLGMLRGGKAIRRGLDLTHTPPAKQAGRLAEEGARLRRATEQGYTTDVFHGTRSPGFEAFEPHVRDFGIHVTPRPQTAEAAVLGPSGPANMRAIPEMAKSGNVNVDELIKGYQTWAGMPGSGRGALGPAVMPLKARIQNPVTLPDFGRWDEVNPTVLKLIKTNRAFASDQKMVDDILAKGTQLLKPNPRTLQYDAHDQRMAEWRQFLLDRLKQGGYDAIAYPNYQEGAGELSYALFDPSQLRLPWAAFKDPTSKNLLAGVGGAAAAGSVAASKKKTERRKPGGS